MNVLDLFSGIGAFSLGLERAGIAPSSPARSSRGGQSKGAGMSINGNHMGGQYPSPPPTPRDFVIVTVGVIVILAVVFGPLVLACAWWVFG